MTTQGKLAELFGRRRFAIQPGIERIESLLNHFRNPERCFTTLHVVGTNGKGSTSAFLSSILTQAGYCTGLFTSPHLVSYTERFRINSTEINEEELSLLLNELLAEPEAAATTFFELTTALACRWFAQRQVQMAVIEAGMGGRSDATAALRGVATIITPISQDHSQWLGNTLTHIAQEKVGIAAPGTPIISAPQSPAVLEVIEHYCSEHGNRLMYAGRDYSATENSHGNLQYSGSRFCFPDMQLALNGRYQLTNAALAIAAAEQIDQLGFTIAETAVLNGLRHASWPGRMEEVALDNGTPLLLDGAHNPAGAVALADELNRFSNRRIIMVLGMMEDKDPAGIVAPLLPHANLLITTAPAQDRALSADQLATLCRSYSVPTESIPVVADALHHISTITVPGDLVVAAGSLFLIGEIKACLSGTACEAVRG